MATLQALISASPSYLRVYQSQCHSILSSILLRGIHPDVLFDALAILDAQKLPRNYDDYVPHLKAFVEQYKTTRASLDVALEPLEPSTKEGLWKFHLSVIDVTKEFCDYALSEHPVTGHSLKSSPSLSSNEVCRIHRAFYRYELFTLLFFESPLYSEEQNERHRDRDPDRARLALERDSIRSLDAQDQSWLFLVLSKAWEVEELVCVRDYIARRYAELYKKYKMKVQELSEFESHHDTAPWDYEDDACHEHYLSLGLGFFHTIIKAPHEDQMRILRENSGFSYTSLSSTLEEEGREWDTPMYDEWASGATLDFERDSDKDGPNAAWTWSTGHKAEIRYDQFSKKGLRKWGYVMWDKERLDR